MTFGYQNPYASTTTPQQGYTLANGTLVKPATAVSGSMAGSYGGEGMAMPAGATASGGGGANYMAGATFALNGLSDAAQQYATADSQKMKYVTPMSMALADYPIAQVGHGYTPTA